MVGKRLVNCIHDKNCLPKTRYHKVSPRVLYLYGSPIEATRPKQLQIASCWLEFYWWVAVWNPPIDRMRKKLHQPPSKVDHHHPNMIIFGEGPGLAYGQKWALTTVLEWYV